MPCGLCAAVPVMKQSNEKPINLNNNEEQVKKLTRPSELPIYTKEPSRQPSW